MYKDSAYLLHMEEEIHYLMGIGETTPIESKIGDPTLKRAVIRSIEILGEASKNVSPGFEQQHPEINWADIAGIRDILAHRYFGVDWDVVADVMYHEIPRMKIQIDAILTELTE